MVTSFGALLPAVAQAAPPVEPTTSKASKADPADELPNPLEDKRRELREEALAAVLKGEAKPVTRGASTVVKVGKTRGGGETDRTVSGSGVDQYVELARKTTDKIFVILAEFGNERHPKYPDVDSDPETPGPTTFEGPLHNKIPAPDRTKDNTTVWQPDYNRAHFEKLYFGEGKNVESLKTYYEMQSSNVYSVEGKVTEWVKVKYNEARYGRDCDIDKVCTDTNMWALVTDAANQWVADQKAAGRTDAQIKADMKSFDKWDRYDFDNDSNFNESDGYIDHFQIVHAGGDQADGDPQQGEDAIWAHRWYAYNTSAGVTGPAQNKAGGTQIGNTGVWIGDYTVQPENGGLSVFAHEYGHDLGLPDDYDTSGGSNNNSEYWTLMAQSRLSGEGEPLGTRPGDLGAWQKLRLGWLDHVTLKAGKKKTLELGPQEYHSKKPQAAVIVLPKKAVEKKLGAPFAGTKQFFSGNANSLNTTLTQAVDLTGKTSASFDLKGRYAIEAGYDYLYVEVSENGTTWTPVDGTIDGTPFGKDGAEPGRPTISGTSGGAWKSIHVPLDAYAGKKIQVRLHYLTDGGKNDGGFFGDDLTITADGAALSTDGAEGDLQWKPAGFSAVGASITGMHDHYYIAGNRTYVSYDKYLKTGPYNIGWASTKPDWAEHFSYQQGLLISYSDTSQEDNNVNQHPGEGRNMIIDSRPEPMYNMDGQPWRARIQLYDAPFGLKKADSFTLHVDGKPSYIRGPEAESVFDDKKQHWFADAPWHGVKLPRVGVKIKVLEQKGTSIKIRVS
ncbi:immune inhibitor A domain-containing protein [Couchioplanes caeruleus]|uniref:Protease n=2 Tax=Couchioplanes caeruleus TaxID=56438 RepID=A0A1K0FCV6_9ACTN|nr:immune inhibitor A domain-containing protein [Couchioplanes caeruleus]OJF10657.1 protease [Couchioplanes caeruleus subsp. caeruleus]